MQGNLPAGAILLGATIELVGTNVGTRFVTLQYDFPSGNLQDARIELKKGYLKGNNYRRVSWQGRLPANDIDNSEQRIIAQIRNIPRTTFTARLSWMYEIEVELYE